MTNDRKNEGTNPVLRFSANLSMLFTEYPLVERFAVAARAGFRAVEIQFPYELPASEIAALLRANAQQIVLHNLPAGDWTAGERGIACHPDRVEEFRAGVAQAIDYASQLGCPQLNCLAGIAPHGVADAILRQTFIANLCYASGELSRAGLRLLIEPINIYDMPGFYLNRTQQALDLIDAVKEEASIGNLFLQYDVYHAERMEGGLGTCLDFRAEKEAKLARLLPYIAHIQLADTPGRNEPGSGEINFPWLFRQLDALGYAGWLGCEYTPASTTEAGLVWRENYGFDDQRDN